MMFYVLTSQNRDYLAWLHWKIRSQEYSFDLIRSFQSGIYGDFPFSSLIFEPAMFDSQTVKLVKRPPKISPRSVPSQNLQGRSTGLAGAHWSPGVHNPGGFTLTQLKSRIFWEITAFSGYTNCFSIILDYPRHLVHLGALQQAVPNKSMANWSRNMNPKPYGKYIWPGTSGEDLGPVWNQNCLVRNVHA
jgi:hypothetical protein